MKTKVKVLWQKYKYKLNFLILILPIYFFYRSLHPVFPPAWPAQTIGSFEQKFGPFEITPMPFDLEPAYRHEDTYVKDFLLMFNQGDISQIRQAYLNIGEQPLALDELQQGGDGILHGSRHGQHVHALTQGAFTPGQKMWLTIQNWQGKQMTTSWDLPASLLTQ